MPISKREAKEIKVLVDEGKQISRIVADDFPQYDYWDVYYEAYGSGGQSAQGVKWMITNRLNHLNSVDAEERQRIVEELSDLIRHLYDNYKSSQKKLEIIRKALAV